MDEHIRILELAEKNQLPDCIDKNSPVSVTAFKELFEEGLMKGIDMSHATGTAYLEPRITIPGRKYLKELREESLKPVVKQRKDMRLSERFRRLTLWNKIGLIGAVTSILGIPLAIALYFLGQKSTQQTNSQPTIQPTVFGKNNITALNLGSGTVNITHIDGIDLKEHQAIAKQLGVTEAALNSFFKILEQRAIPPEDLDSTLRTIAERYKALDEKLKTFASNDSTVQALKEQARQALEAGKFDRAEQLLNEASEKDLQAIQQIQQSTEELEAIIQKNKAIVRKRLLSAAASKAENGDLKYTQLAYMEAAAYYRQAAELVPTDEQSILAEYLNKEGVAWFNAGHYAKAQTPLERTVSIREKALGPTHLDVATSLNNLAALYRAQGRYEQAEPLYQRALDIREKILEPTHPYIAQSLSNLAMLYYDQGRYEQAEPLYQRALAIDEKALGPEHPNLAPDLNNLAALYDDQGHYEAAESLYQRALKILEKVLGPAHPHITFSLNNLAELYRVQGRYEQAEPLYQRALGIRKKVLGSAHPAIATSLNNLAELYRVQGQYEQAEPLYQRALSIQEKALGPEHPNVAASLNNLAKLYFGQGRYEESKPLYQRALGIVEKALGPKHPNSIRVRENYADLLEKMKQADMALSTAE